MSTCLSASVAGCYGQRLFVWEISSARQFRRALASGLQTRTNRDSSLPSSARTGPRAAVSSARYFSTSKSRRLQAPSIQYHAAAAFSAKRHPLDLDQNIYVHTPADGTQAKSTQAIRPESKRPKSGQDAFFISDVGGSSDIAFGVVDGVGGWEDSGVDPANFAHSLCEYMAHGASTNTSDSPSPKSALQPVDLLEDGFQEVLADKRVVAGGSTACVGIAAADGAITMANLGDSGFAHLTPFQLSSVSPPQTHAFNTPYQLAKLPPRMLAQIKVFGGPKPHSETPVDSAVTNHKVKHGDVIILATDGVWDNLFSEDLLRITSKIMENLKAWTNGKSSHASIGEELATLADNRKGGNSLAAMIAKAITREAKLASVDPKRMGPFAKEVQRTYPDENWQGGKEDDICTVVLVAVKQ